uniref:Uncharacterized protein n=1 Tax=Molossus molossus TaxID=27622 RepID=A0A7J8E315_MOLMO|nr:hypothetical protein HJG59_009064 [Molossus molossus]
MRRAASSPSAPTFVLALIRLIRTKTSASRIWCPYPLLGRDLLQRSFNCWPLPLQARPRIKFHKTLAINPASLPPDDDPEKPLQDGLEAIDTADGRPDLRDDPLPSSDEVLLMDESNYVQEDIRYAGATVVTLDHVIK